MSASEGNCAVAGFGLGVLAAAVGAWLMVSAGEPPAAAVAEPRVVRMLDVTIRDSNTTNRRQRFICEEARR